MLILLFGYLFLERFLFRGSLGRLFVQGWRRLLRNGWDALSRALRLPAGRREKQTQLTCRDCPKLLPDSGSLVPHVSYAVGSEPPYHERTEWKMPSKQRLRTKRPEGTDEMIVGTFDPETGEEIEQRKIACHSLYTDSFPLFIIRRRPFPISCTLLSLLFSILPALFLLFYFLILSHSFPYSITAIRSVRPSA